MLALLLLEKFSRLRIAHRALLLERLAPLGSILHGFRCKNFAAPGLDRHLLPLVLQLPLVLLGRLPQCAAQRLGRLSLLLQRPENDPLILLAKRAPSEFRHFDDFGRSNGNGNSGAEKKPRRLRGRPITHRPVGGIGLLLVVNLGL